MIKCIKGHEIKVLESGAGFYVGTLDPADGCPYCRISNYRWNIFIMNVWFSQVKTFIATVVVIAQPGSHLLIFLNVANLSG